MPASSSSNRALRFLAAGLGLAAGAYVGHTVITWFSYGRFSYGRLRYGRGRDTDAGKEAASLLDRFMPAYEVVEHHQIRLMIPRMTCWSRR